MVNKISWKSVLIILRPWNLCFHCIPSFDQLGNNARKVHTIRTKETPMNDVKYSNADRSFYCIA